MPEPACSFHPVPLPPNRSVSHTCRSTSALLSPPTALCAHPVAGSPIQLIWTRFDQELPSGSAADDLSVIGAKRPAAEASPSLFELLLGWSPPASLRTVPVGRYRDLGACGR